MQKSVVYAATGRHVDARIHDATKGHVWGQGPTVASVCADARGPSCHQKEQGSCKEGSERLLRQLLPLQSYSQGNKIGSHRIELYKNVIRMHPHLMASHAGAGREGLSSIEEAGY